MSNHLNTKDIDEGKELMEILDTLDDASKKTVLIYASGLRDRQMITEDKTA